jgi:hypothetical protein
MLPIWNSSDRVPVLDWAKREDREMTVLRQIREAWKNPLATYLVSHYEASKGQPWLWTIVLGGLLVSAPTVYEWAQAAFQNKPKSLGFVMLLEGTMILSGIQAIAIGCLGLLVVINAVGAAASLARRDVAKKAEAKASARRMKVAA